MTLAILSGRDLADLQSRTAGVLAYRCGSHGLDVATPAGEILRSTPPLSVSPPERWLREAAALGLTIELKRHGIAVHWRRVAGIAITHPAIRSFEAWAESEGLTTIGGRCVLEARLPGPDKRETLIELAAATRAERVIYAGDDLTDYAAIEWAVLHGEGIFVASDECSGSPAGATTLSSRDDLLSGIRQAIGYPV